MTEMQSFLQTMEIPSSRRDNNISSNEANRIKENSEYFTTILRALHYFGRHSLALGVNTMMAISQTKMLLIKETLKSCLMLCVKVMIVCVNCLKNVKKKCHVGLKNYSK